MPRILAKKKADSLPAYSWSADIPMRFARQVAERFKPDKIILFGSYAYGTPNENSDIDILRTVAQ
jgi:predicted nucleotidyltransferase